MEQALQAQMGVSVRQPVCAVVLQGHDSGVAVHSLVPAEVAAFAAPRHL